MLCCICVVLTTCWAKAQAVIWMEYSTTVAAGDHFKSWSPGFRWTHHNLHVLCSHWTPWMLPWIPPWPSEVKLPHLLPTRHRNPQSACCVPGRVWELEYELVSCSWKWALVGPGLSYHHRCPQRSRAVVSLITWVPSFEDFWQFLIHQKIPIFLTSAR